MSKRSSVKYSPSIIKNESMEKWKMENKLVNKYLPKRCILLCH